MDWIVSLASVPLTGTTVVVIPPYGLPDWPLHACPACRQNTTSEPVKPMLEGKGEKKRWERDSGASTWAVR